jgi:hypothetical protein
MALFMGQFLISGELLNKVAAPLLKKQYRFLRELSFRIVDDFVMAEIAGRYNLLGFKGFVAVHLLEFFFARYRLPDRPALICRNAATLSKAAAHEFAKEKIIPPARSELVGEPFTAGAGGDALFLADQ